MEDRLNSFKRRTGRMQQWRWRANYDYRIKRNNQNMNEVEAAVWEIKIGKAGEEDKIYPETVRWKRDILATENI